MDKNQTVPKTEPLTLDSGNKSIEKATAKEIECKMPEKPDFRCLNFILFCISAGYFMILVSVLVYVFVVKFGGMPCNAGCNNYSLLLIVVMLLATIVLLFALNSSFNMKREGMEEYYKGLEKYNRIVAELKSNK